MNKKNIDQTSSKSGTLLIIAAPSGAGKTTLVRKICEQMPNFLVSISHTTRPKRSGEIDGKDYFFINGATFAEMVAQEKFLEHASVFDYNYGTLKHWVEEKLKQNIDIILEIDWQGAQDIRKLMPESTSIFILPPSFAALEKRLNNRGDDDEKTIQQRMQGALNEISHYKEFDYLVVNDDLESALEELRTIIESIRQNNPYQAPDNGAFAEQIMAQGAEVQ
jgi:guanylate kinase